MKLSNLVFLIIGATLIFFGCSEKNPSAPELSQSDQVTNSLAKQHLTGTLNTVFTPTPPYFWNGTIEIEGYGIYDLRFENVSGPPPPGRNAILFEERFEISQGGILLLAGKDAGVLNMVTDKFLANGNVELAAGPFEMWISRNVHINGIITWLDKENGIPLSATGTFRIN